VKTDGGSRNPVALPDAFLEKRGFDSMYSRSLMLRQLYLSYGSTIDQQRFIRDIIDFYYDKTRWAMINIGFLYLFFFFLPFLIQIYINDGIVLILCLSSCCCSQFFFFAIELNQIRLLKMKYFVDVWNYFDIVQIMAFASYLIARFFIRDPIRPIENDSSRPQGEMCAWVYMNTFMLLISY
jgi:hypothetical protein